MGNSTSSDSWLDSIFQGKTASNLEAEIKSYLQEPTEDKNVHPLEYCLLKKQSYPTLCLMAKNFLPSLPLAHRRSALFRLVD